MGNYGNDDNSGNDDDNSNDDDNGISSSNKSPFSLFSTSHTIDSGSLGPKLMFCGQSMPTPQLRKDH